MASYPRKDKHLRCREEESVELGGERGAIFLRVLRILPRLAIGTNWESTPAFIPKHSVPSAVDE
jgi:hypothetical protein